MDHTHLKPNHILVVDDDNYQLEVIKTFLDKAGFRVTLVQTGLNAISLAQQNSFDLILLDINLPDTEGFYVCQTIKSDPQLADIPVLFLSSNTDVQHKLKGFEVGGADYITKPVIYAELLARVNSHLRLSQKRLSEKQNPVASQIVFRANLFGSLSLKHHQEELILPKSSSAKSLLAYLMLHQGTSLPRIRVAGQIWPDYPEAKSLKMISQGLWLIRNMAPNIQIHSDAYTIEMPLDISIWVDAMAFQTILKNQVYQYQLTENEVEQLYQAVNLYQDDLLVDFYDEWILPYRRSYERQFIECLWKLLRYEKQQNNDDQIYSLLQKLAEYAESERPLIYFEKIRLFAKQKNYTEALRQYSLYQADTTQIQDTTLDEEIQQFVQTMRGQLRQEQTISTTDDYVWIGKDKAFNLFKSYIEQTIRGEPMGVITLHSGVGMGASTFAQKATTWVTNHGIQTIYIYSRENSSPYYLIEKLIMHLEIDTPTIWETVESLKETSPATSYSSQLTPLEQKLMVPLIPLVEDKCQTMKHFVVLEQTHWLDNGSLKLLAYLNEQRLAGCLFLFISYRLHDYNHFLIQHLFRHKQTTHLHLENWNREQLRHYLQLTIKAFDIPILVLEQLMHKTGGNVKLVNLLIDEWQTKIIATQQESSIAKLPQTTLSNKAKESVFEAYLAPLAQTQDGLLDTLNYLCIFTTEKSKNFLQTFFGQNWLTRKIQVDQLVKIGILQRDEETAVSFTYTLLRELLYERLDTQAKVGSHQKALETYTQLIPNHLHVLIHHAEQAHQWQTAFEKALLLGNQKLQIYAFTDAETWYKKALIFLKRTTISDKEKSSLEFDILLKLWRMSLQNSADKEKIDLYERLKNIQEDQPQNLQAVYLNLLSNFTSKIHNDYEASEQQAQKALQITVQINDRSEQLESHLALGKAYLSQHKIDPAKQQFYSGINLYTIDQAHEMKPDEVTAIVACCYYLIFLHSREQDMDQAQKLLTQASKYVEGNAVQSPYTFLFLYESYSSHARSMQQYDKALEYSQKALHYIQQAQLLANEITILASIGSIQMRLIRYQDAYISLNQAVSLARQTEQRDNILSKIQLLIQLLLHIGRHKECTYLLDEAYILSQELDLPHRTFLSCCDFITFFLYQAKPQKAYEWLEKAKKPLAQLHDERQNSIWHQKMGEYYISCYQWQPALEHFAESLVLLPAEHPETRLISLQKAYAMCRLGDTEKAYALAKTIYTHIEGKDNRECSAHCYWLLWKTYIAQNDPKAIDFLKMARDILQKQQTSLPNDEWCQTFIKNNQWHVQIIKDYESWVLAQNSTQITVKLPHKNAPMGRALTEEEFVMVTWTISAPEDSAFTKKSKLRQHQLKRLLTESEAQNGIPTHDDLAEALDVSRKTIQRDIKALQKSGFVAITRGLVHMNLSAT